MECEGILKNEGIKWNGYDAFKEYEVQAESVEDFLERYTKPQRHNGRGEEYEKARIKSYSEQLKKDGYTIMSKHESVTGEIVSYYGNRS